MKNPNKENYWLKENEIIKNGVKYIPFDHISYENDLEAYIHHLNNKDKPIDYVTTTNLNYVLKKMDINLNIKMLDVIIDVVEMLEDNEGSYSDSEIEHLNKLHNEEFFDLN